MQSKKQAFTIIEVVLVLAIAGLIFLIVFIALPALQRSQRNTRRKQDLSRVASAITDYQAANNKTPFDIDYSSLTQSIDKDFITHYVDKSCKDLASFTSTTTGSHATGYTFKSCSDQFTDPNGTTYTIIYNKDLLPNGANLGPSKVGEEFLVTQTDFPLSAFVAFTHASCGHEDTDGYSVIRANGPNDYALVTQLEGGAYYCQDNQ